MASRGIFSLDTRNGGEKETAKDMIARDPRTEWAYVPASDRGLTDKSLVTTFRLRHMTLLQEAATLDALDRDSNGISIRRNLGSDRVNLLRSNLVGWSNLRKEDGSEVMFEKGPMGGAKDELIYLLPPRLRDELARAIEDAQIYDPDEASKSSPQST